jgi:hypothetical protein
MVRGQRASEVYAKMESENDEPDAWMSEHLALDVMAEQRLEAFE